LGEILPFVSANDTKLYYELTGPVDQPMILQFGGWIFGRHNFAMVNDAFRSRFRLLSYDASGYGRSDCPLQEYSIEGWAEEAKNMLDALGIERVFAHGTSNGGFIAIAFTALYPERVIAASADCAFARVDKYRALCFRTWRHAFECMPIDEVSNLITTVAVAPRFLEENPDILKHIQSMINRNSPYTVRMACLAVERMDLEALACEIRRPILFTNATHDMVSPPRLAVSGFSAENIVRAVPDYATLYEFPEIGHAPLLEATDEAVQLVGDFFMSVLDAETNALAVS
jgi:pimeloyl-ACP methyl ester carboxylesterase